VLNTAIVVRLLMFHIKVYWQHTVMACAFNFSLKRLPILMVRSSTTFLDVAIRFLMRSTGAAVHRADARLVD